MPSFAPETRMLLSDGFSSLGVGTLRYQTWYTLMLDGGAVLENVVTRCLFAARCIRNGRLRPIRHWDRGRGRLTSFQIFSHHASASWWLSRGYRSSGVPTYLQ